MAKLNIITLGSSKNYTNMVSLGLASATVDDVNKSITFTLSADGSQHTIHFDQPSDGVSVTGISDKGNGKFTLLFSDGSESDPIQTVKGQKGDKLTFNDLTDAEKDSLKGSDGFSPSAKIEKVGDTATITITDKDGTTTATIKDGQCGGTADVPIEKIKVNGELQTPVNKVVDITVPDAYDDTDIRAELANKADITAIPTVDVTKSYVDTELANKADTDHTHTTVNGHTVESDVPVDAKFTDTVYDDTQVKTQIQAVANGLMDSVGYSADYKTIDIIAKNGVKKSVNVAPIISHASITELSDVDTTNKATGKALVYNATTSKHEYTDVSGTDEKVKMDASTDAKYLGELLDNITIANENGELKVKKLDGQEVTITEINYLKGLTMNVMDLVNMFSNGGVKIINTPVATYAELLTLDKSSFIEGISYLVYVLADENHDNAKTTYLVDKDSETPTYFGFADSQRDFTTNPIDLATEITGKLGIANMDSDAIKALFTVDDTYKTETATNNAFSTHGAKALYDELLLAIGNKANDSDLTAHKDDTDIHVSTEDRTKWDSAKTHADSAHAPSNAQENVLETVKVNNQEITPDENKAVNIDLTDYAKKTDLHSHDNKSVLDEITSDKVTAWDNKSEFSGSYNDLNDKPTIDAELSNTSENAIQNKVVTKEINKLYSDISFNDHDTATDGISFTDAEDGNMIVTDWTKNLFNSTLKTNTSNGVTCTNNGDGTYTLNGTSTKDRWISFGYTTLKPGKYKFIATENNVRVNNLCVSLNSTVIAMSGDIFTVQSKGVYDIGLSTYNKTFNNVLIKPIITIDLSATYDDFVPYGGYEIQSCGKNLLNPNDYIDGRNIKNDFDTLYSVNTISDDRIWSYEESNYYFKAKTQNMTLIIYVVESVNSGGFGVFSEDGIVIYNKFSGGFPNTGIHKYVLNVKPEKMYGIMLKLYSGKVKISLYNSDETEFEPYQGESIKVTNDTESPAFGLKSRKGITNIISPGNVKVTYAKSDSGKAILDTSENKLDKDNVVNNQTTTEAGFALDARQANPNIDGTLAKQVNDLNGKLSIASDVRKETTVNLLNLTLQTTTQNGLTCTNNGDGTYTLNGTATAQTTYIFADASATLAMFKGHSSLKLVGFPKKYASAGVLQVWRSSDNLIMRDKGDGVIITGSNIPYGNCNMAFVIYEGAVTDGMIIKPMLTTNLNATYDDFVSYTGDSGSLNWDVASLLKRIETLESLVNKADTTVTE